PGSTGRKVIINPKRQIWTKASCADYGECIRREKVRARQKAGRRNNPGRLFFVPRKVSFVPECDRNTPWYLAWIDRARKCLLLRLRSQQNRRILYERLVVFRKLESILLERLSKVIQLRIVAMASRAGSLIFP